MRILQLHKKAVERLTREGWVKVGTVIQTDMTSECFGGLWVKDGKQFYLNYMTLNGIGGAV